VGGSEELNALGLNPFRKNPEGVTLRQLIVIGQLSSYMKTITNLTTQRSTHEDQKTSYTKHIYSNVMLSMSNMDTYTKPPS
jgi:hypothetical protein